MPSDGGEDAREELRALTSGLRANLAARRQQTSAQLRSIRSRTPEIPSLLCGVASARVQPRAET